MSNPADIILLYALIPVWLAVGVLDWWCHKKAGIEHTSGTRESILHLLMFIEAGIALLAGLFLEINALVLAFMLVLLMLHELTAIWDLEYADPRRKITTLEQHTHSFLEVLPFMAFSLLCCIYWEQFSALIGTGDATADFSLHWKRHALPQFYVIAVLVCAALIDMGVYIEELYRCLKTAADRS
ncbi:MAG TPA: hypothetical protein VFT64_05365 [Rickettsiales bacterium]|nr:hypothetical protein [Rickettsiales bacterium]